MKVEVVRSPRRRKTVQARQIGGVLRVHIPASMSPEEERHWVAEMVRRIERRGATEAVDLQQRARMLAGRFGLRQPASIRWVDNQEMRWGSCTPRDATIRISSKLVREPLWVLDYVIVHELAHLTVAGHGPRFWDLVHRYPMTERARGFLIARGMEGDDTPADSAAGHSPGPDRGGQGSPGELGYEAVAAGLERPAPPVGRRRSGSSGR